MATFFRKLRHFRSPRKDDQNAKRRNLVKQRTELKLCWLRSLSKLRQLRFDAVPRFILGYESEAFSETFPMTPYGHLVLQLAAPPWPWCQWYLWHTDNHGHKRSILCVRVCLCGGYVFILSNPYVCKSSAWPLATLSRDEHTSTSYHLSFNSSTWHLHADYRPRASWLAQCISKPLFPMQCVSTKAHTSVHMNVDMIVGSMCTFPIFVVRFPLLKSWTPWIPAPSAQAGTGRKRLRTQHSTATWPAQV